MKEIKDMNADELFAYCADKINKGASFRDIANIFKMNGTDDDTRKQIMSKLDAIDRQHKAAVKNFTEKNERKNGFINLLIGFGITTFGTILYKMSIREGVIFYLNFAIWGFGLLMIIRGFVSMVSGKKSI